MKDYIGQRLEDFEKDLDNQNISYQIVNNNHNVDGDVTLVTNQKVLQDKTVLLTVGKFLFKLKDWLLCQKK